MMLQRTGEAETITTHYLFALGMYRGLYIPNWIYRYFADDTVDPIAVVAGVVQTVLYGDFFYSEFLFLVRHALSRRRRILNVCLSILLQSTSPSMWPSFHPCYCLFWLTASFIVFRVLRGEKWASMTRFIALTCLTILFIQIRASSVSIAKEQSRRAMELGISRNQASLAWHKVNNLLCMEKPLFQAFFWVAVSVEWEYRMKRRQEIIIWCTLSSREAICICSEAVACHDSQSQYSALGWAGRTLALCQSEQRQASRRGRGKGSRLRRHITSQGSSARGE